MFLHSCLLELLRLKEWKVLWLYFPVHVMFWKFQEWFSLLWSVWTVCVCTLLLSCVVVVLCAFWLTLSCACAPPFVDVKNGSPWHCTAWWPWRLHRKHELDRCVISIVTCVIESTIVTCTVFGIEELWVHSTHALNNHLFGRSILPSGMRIGPRVAVISYSHCICSNVSSGKWIQTWYFWRTYS